MRAQLRWFASEDSGDQSTMMTVDLTQKERRRFEQSQSPDGVVTDKAVAVWRFPLVYEFHRWISSRGLLVLAMFSYLFTLGANVASAECFEYTIKIPTAEYGTDFVGEALVSWCSEVSADTGELQRQLSFSSCKGSGPGYVSCSTHPHDSTDTSFAVLAEWVFCPLAPGGGCLWVVFDNDVQFDASGAVTTLSENVRTARSGPPDL